jgi:hypothetical protein
LWSEACLNCVGDGGGVARLLPGVNPSNPSGNLPHGDTYEIILFMFIWFPNIKIERSLCGENPYIPTWWITCINPLVEDAPIVSWFIVKSKYISFWCNPHIDLIFYMYLGDGGGIERPLLPGPSIPTGKLHCMQY